MGLKPGLFGSNGEMWRRQRRMVMAAFDPAHIKRYFPALCRVAQRLVGRWQIAARDGRAIDLQADLMRYTVDTIAGLAFGAEVNTLESDEDVIQQHLDKIFPALARRLAAALPMWRWLPSRADRELKRSMVAVNEAVDGFVAQARARLKQDPERAKNPPNLLEAMIVAADEPDSGIDDAQVAGNVLTMLLAGEDTTANTIAWMIYLLSRPPAGARARGARGASRHRRSEKPDARAARPARLCRSLRPRDDAAEAGRADDRAGTGARNDDRQRARAGRRRRIRADAPRQRRATTYLPNAAEFRPERWLAGEAPRRRRARAKRISMPFGAGPRICPGVTSRCSR
jgi:cytochrome P450